MCGRYVLKREDLNQILQKLGVALAEDFQSRYNIAPTSTIPAIRSAPDASSREAVPLRWGLIPSWTPRDTAPRPLPNVRSDTLLRRFGGTARAHRCLVPASGFYEWQPVGTVRQPWLFRRRDAAPFLLAGIWETWRTADGFSVDTAALITTDADALMQPIHHRRPVVFGMDQAGAWLGAETDAKIDTLLASATDDFVAEKVSLAVNNARNDGPECLMPASASTPESGPQLSLGF
jgi:putative SOS response-associated peptidase YedK